VRNSHFDSQSSGLPDRNDGGLGGFCRGATQQPRHYRLRRRAADNNSGNAIAPIIECVFTNAGKPVMDTRAIVDPIGPGER
jgi:hypothetical protein